MFGGIPELLIVMVMMVLWFVPVAAAIWALITLHRIRAEQQTMQLKLDAIARQLSRS